ncbi:MAG: ASKHA domain-containing protein, partial [Candidatus Korarchaeota archaeon]|nr:ASKHA domain-containing protein [Candidatus Korarchaeota archaeon]
GLSGSGLISAVAEMLRWGLLSENGRMSRELGGKLRLVDSPRIEVTQRDVREVQKAVAAVYSAWRILMRRKGLSHEDLKGVYLAGTFGSHVDPSDAIEIGLIPPVDPETVVSLGNTALSGAKLLILSEDAFTKFNELYSMVTYVDLARDPEFSEAFIEGTYLRGPPPDPSSGNL